MSWSQLLNVATGEAIALVLVLAATGLFRLDRWRYRRNITESTRTPHSSTQPLRPHGILKPADLQQSIEYSARIPLEFRPHPKRLRAIRQTSKLFFIANRTTPKQAFRISCWRYQPNTFRDTNRRFDPHGGFIFSFRIHENENRWHFRHSLRAGGFIAPSTALVVIASAKDLATPAAWVRCLVVSSLFLDLPKDRRGPIAVQSSDPLADNESSAYSVRLQYVPEHAIWLITTDPQHTVPTTDWHKSPESLEFPESLEYPQTPATTAETRELRPLHQAGVARKIPVHIRGGPIPRSHYRVSLLWTGSSRCPLLWSRNRNSCPDCGLSLVPRVDLCPGDVLPPHAQHPRRKGAVLAPPRGPTQQRLERRHIPMSLPRPPCQYWPNSERQELETLLANPLPTIPFPAILWPRLLTLTRQRNPKE